MSSALAWNPTLFGGDRAVTLAAMDSPVLVTAAAEADSQEVELKALIASIQEGNQQALAKLYDLTISRIYGLALRIAGRADAAEEVAEDVYLQIWRSARDYSTERGKVIAWMLTICRSRAIDHLRRRDDAVSTEHPEDLAPHPEDDDPQDLLSAAQRNSRLHAAISQLQAQDRQLLSLAFFRGLTHEEIAAHTQLPLGTVKTCLRRALTQLRAQLGGAD